MLTLLVLSAVFLSLQVEVEGTSNGAALEKRQASRDRVLRVTTILNPPLMMQKPKSNRESGNDRFEGFLAEMFAVLAAKLNITYSIHVVKDGNYGSSIADSNDWTGMIGEILNGEADFAVADMTITSARKNVVHFTHPFMTSGIGILISKTEEPMFDTFFFLSPLGKDVWIGALITLIVMTAALFLFARFSFAEWTTENELTGAGIVPRQNRLNLSNALYFMLASVTHQNANVAPRALSTRLLSITWWIFCFFLTAVYIANLSAILVHHIDEMTVGSGLQDVEDLARQTKIKYGTLQGGSTKSFFQTSSIGTYQRMFAFMESEKPSVYVKSYVEGLNRVMNEKYALFMESTSIDYARERYCNLTQLGSLLDYKGYGIAMHKDSPYLHQLSHAILEMQDRGDLLKLKKKWWGEDGGGGLCSKAAADTPSVRTSIYMDNFRGVFVILGFGGAISLIVAFVELVFRARAGAKEQGGSLSEELKRETRFALSGGSVRNSKRDANRDDGGIILQRQDH